MHRLNFTHPQPYYTVVTYNPSLTSSMDIKKLTVTDQDRQNKRTGTVPTKIVSPIHVLFLFSIIYELPIQCPAKLNNYGYVP